MDNRSVTSWHVQLAGTRSGRNHQSVVSKWITFVQTQQAIGTVYRLYLTARDQGDVFFA